MWLEMGDVGCMNEVIEWINGNWLIYKILDFVPWVEKNIETF